MGLLEGQAQFVWHFRMDEDPEEMLCTIGTEGTFANSVDTANVAFTAWVDNLLPLQSGKMALWSCEHIVQEAGGASVAVSTASSDSGGRLGECLTPNTAFLIRKYTGAVGRGKNGRMYVPGCSDSDVKWSGAVDPIHAGAWNENLSEFLDVFDGIVVGGLVVNHGEGSALGLSDDIASMACDLRAATQRRRLRP